MICTVTFNPAVDYVVHLEKLTPGGVNRTDAEEFQPGGKGINVSLVLHSLGVESVALGFLAGFTGDAVEQGLRARGVAAEFIRLPGGATRINVKIKAGEETEINGRGPAVSSAALEQLLRRLEKLESGDILVLAGSVPPSVPADIYERILRRIGGRGVRAAVDAAGMLLRSVLPHRPFLIKPNHLELGELFGKTLSDDGQVAACAAQLQKEGARNVLVSMAARGALLLDETGRVHRTGAPAGTVKNSVGAGDSMVAGFLAGYLETQDYAYALRMGTAAGSATAFSPGLATRGEVLRLMGML